MKKLVKIELRKYDTSKMKLKLSKISSHDEQMCFVSGKIDFPRGGVFSPLLVHKHQIRCWYQKGNTCKATLISDIL